MVTTARRVLAAFPVLSGPLELPASAGLEVLLVLTARTVMKGRVGPRVTTFPVELRDLPGLWVLGGLLAPAGLPVLLDLSGRKALVGLRVLKE